MHGGVCADTATIASGIVSVNSITMKYQGCAVSIASGATFNATTIVVYPTGSGIYKFQTTGMTVSTPVSYVTAMNVLYSDYYVNAGLLPFWLIGFVLCLCIFVSFFHLRLSLGFLSFVSCLLCS